MGIADNVIGLGIAPAVAARLSNAGTGPLSLKAAGSSTATGTVIGGKQFVVFVNSGSGWATLPTVGGTGPQDAAPEYGDDFVIHNSLASPVTIGIPAGVTVNIAGANLTGNFTLTLAQTVTLWVVNNTQWFGIKA